MTCDRDFLPVRIAVLTVSDTRTTTDDRSGDTGAGAALDRRGADLGVGDQREEGGEGRDRLLVERFVRLHGDVAAGEASAAGG